MTDYITYPRGKPFGRAIAMREAIIAARRIGDPIVRSNVMAAIPPYRSRGKGWKRGGFIKTCLSRTQNPKPSGWDPHIGDKQIAKGLKRAGL